MRRAAIAWLALSVACAAQPPSPARLETNNEQCGFCRMAVSDARFAGQLVAPNEEPKFFDDLGCLAQYLKANRAPPKGAIVFVADHRTKQWVSAAKAVYTRVDGLSTPMGSHLIAHSDATSRAADPDARAGVPVASAQLFAGVIREES